MQVSHCLLNNGMTKAKISEGYPEPDWFPTVLVSRTATVVMYFDVMYRYSIVCM